MANTNYSTDITALTFEHARKPLIDNIFKGNPFTHYLFERNKVELQGGSRITMPLVYATSANVGSFVGFDDIGTDPENITTRCEYPWKYVYANVAISSQEMYENNGPEQILDILMTRMTNAQKSIVEILEPMFLGDGTGNSGKDYMGLAGLVSNTGTVGGINSTTGTAPAGQTWWRSYVDSKAATEEIGTREILQDTISRISKATTDRPDLALYSRTAYNNLVDELWDKRRIWESTTQDMGFPGIAYDGVVCMWTDSDGLVDTATNQDTMYVLNTDYLYLICHETNWMKMDGPVDTPSKRAWYYPIECQGNLVVTQRARQAVIHRVKA